MIKQADKLYKALKDIMEELERELAIANGAVEHLTERAENAERELAEAKSVDEVYGMATAALKENVELKAENENLRRQMTRIAEGRHAASAKGFARQVMWDWPRRKEYE